MNIDPSKLAPYERINMKRYLDSVSQLIEDQSNVSPEIPISDEYCWEHYPGGWSCLACYHEDAMERLYAFHTGIAQIIEAVIDETEERCLEPLSEMTIVADGEIWRVDTEQVMFFLWPYEDKPEVYAVVANDGYCLGNCEACDEHRAWQAAARNLATFHQQLSLILEVAFGNTGIDPDIIDGIEVRV